MDCDPWRFILEIYYGFIIRKSINRCHQYVKYSSHFHRWQKAFAKILVFILAKILFGKEWIHFLSMIRMIYGLPIAKNKWGVVASHTFFFHCWDYLSRWTKKRNRYKQWLHIGKKNVKWTLFRGYIIIYFRNANRINWKMISANERGGPEGCLQNIIATINKFLREQTGFGDFNGKIIPLVPAATSLPTGFFLFLRLLGRRPAKECCHPLWQKKSGKLAY